MALRLAEHRLFVVTLVLAALLRVAVQVAFPPGFLAGDGPTYLGMVDSLQPNPNRPVGYGVVLRVISWVTRDFWAVTITQHVLGLLTAVLLYAAMRRWGVSGPVATLATLPVLFDEMELVLEHLALSDVVFDLLIAVGIVLLAWWRPPRPWAAAASGVVLGLAVVVRLVGQPTILAAVVFCLAAATSLRARVVTALVTCIGFAIPLVAYAGWYHAQYGVWALSEASGRALYMRTTSFVDCSTLKVPKYERTLCPREPIGKRDDPTDYGWHDLRTIFSLNPPPGVTPYEAMHDFGVTAIRAQPWDYVRTVARDVAMTFRWDRDDHYEYDTAYKWNFEYYVDYRPTPHTGPAFAAHGGEQPRTRHPLADWLQTYGENVFLHGPLMLALVVLTLVGLVVRRPRELPVTRSLVFLTGSIALGMILLPDITAEFTWRYQLPGVVLLPVSAALAWTRLRGVVNLGPGRRRAPTGRRVG